MFWRRWKRQFYDGQEVVFLQEHFAAVGRVFSETKWTVTVVHLGSYGDSRHDTVPKHRVRDKAEWDLQKQTG